MGVETMDEFRRAVAAIVKEEEAKRDGVVPRMIKRITGLKNAADIRTLGFLFYYFATLALLWWWEDLIPSDIYGLKWANMTMYWSMWVTNVYFSFLGSVMTHNVMHSALFFKPWANKITQLLLTLTYGHPVSSYVPGHNLSHHKYTQSKRDVMSSYLVNSKYHAVNFLKFQPSVSISVMQSDFRYIMFQKERGNWMFVSQAMRELAFLMLVQGALMYSSFSKWFVLFYVPHFFAQYAIVTLSLLQHDGCEVYDRNRPTIDWNTSRNFTDPVLNFLCLNNGYHTVHHLVPTTHWTYGKIIHDTLVKGRTDERLNWPSMANFVWNQYFCNGNPWNKVKERRMYDGRLDVEPLDVTIGEVAKQEKKVEDAKREKKAEDTTTTSVDSEGLRKRGGSNVASDDAEATDVSKSKPALMYEEWLTFPDDFDPNLVPRTKGELGVSVGVLFVKILISPFYSIDPGLRLV